MVRVRDKRLGIRVSVVRIRDKRLGIRVRVRVGVSA